MTDTIVLSSDLASPADAPPLASWSRRVVAALLDGAILGGATWVVLGSGGLAPSLAPTFGPSHSGEVGLVAWFTSPWLVGLVLGMLVLQGWTGATPGKRVAGIAVVRVADGVPPGVFASGMRVVAHLVDAFLLIGYLRPLWHTHRQTFADSIVGTLVIQTREPPAHPWFARFRRAPSAAGSTSVSMLALAVCVLGVGFSVHASTWSSAWTSAMSCVDDGTVASPSAVANASRDGGTAGERRLWIERSTDTGVDTGVRVDWTWTATDRELVGAVYETDLHRADGSMITVSQDVPETGGPASEPLAQYPADVRASDLREAGAGWSARTRLVVDGETVGACTFDEAAWDAANRG